MEREGAALRRSHGLPMERDLREAVERALVAAADSIAADASAGVPESLEREQGRRLGLLIVQLLSRTIRDGDSSTSAGLVTELHRLTLDRGIPVDRLFGFVYLVERTALDELAVDSALGATTEPWPTVAALIRRASFDFLAAYATRLHGTPDAAAIVDPQTGIQRRVVFEAVLAKELGRAARRGEPVALLLFDIDHLSHINAAYGRATGDRMLERVGILIKGFFRHPDWVGQYGDDEVAVLLTGRDAEQASRLAEEVRRTVEARMQIEGQEPDADGDTVVTVSGAVAVWSFSESTPPDPDRLRAQAESARTRAKRLGRNRIERAGPYSAPISS